MKYISLMIALGWMSAALAESVTCRLDPDNRPNNDRAQSLICGSNIVPDYVRSTEVVSRARIKGRDAAGRIYSADIEVTCQRKTCTLAQIYNRQFDQDRALYAFANGGPAVGPILAWDVEDVTFANAENIRFVEDLATLTPGRKLTEAPISGPEVVLAAGGVPKPEGVTPPGTLRSTVASDARIVTTPAAPVPAPAVAPVPAASVPREEFLNCRYVSRQDSRYPGKPTLINLPEATCRTSQVCVGRTRCESQQSSRQVVDYAFCPSTDNPEDPCPSATECANSTDISFEDAFVPGRVPPRGSSEAAEG